MLCSPWHAPRKDETLSTPAIQERVTIAGEFERIAHRLGRSELIDGRIVEMSPTGAKHGKIEVWIAAILLAYVRSRNLGEVGTGEVGCKLPNGRVRAPDVLFVRAERVPAEGPPDGFWPFAPDLAVEVVSPDDSAREVRDKASDWIAAGSQAVWIADPASRTVTVYALATVPRVLGIGETLEGGSVLPGFACLVDEIFG
ncbi:MAG: Uma2 family endonuclease [Candidatus Schekmanbacteria bacterium]|nr:Uma2 family endonuclease [Candidatus Schekmanbacteria bacterium]